MLPPLLVSSLPEPYTNLQCALRDSMTPVILEKLLRNGEHRQPEWAAGVIALLDRKIRQHRKQGILVRRRELPFRQKTLHIREKPDLLGGRRWLHYLSQQ